MQITEDVTTFTVNGNCVTAVADVFYSGLGFVQLLKELVGLADLQIRAEADCSIDRNEHAKKEPQKGCLAAAIRA